jgi:D-3-phosphoglycerate dehydrogenase
MAKVLITPAPLATCGGPFLEALKAAKFELRFPKKGAQLTEEELMAELPGVSAALAGSEPYTRRVLDAFPKLRVIARAGVGYDAVDVTAATEKGVVVCTTPGTNHDSVAEHTFSLILGIARSVGWQNIRIKAGDWPRQVTQPLRGRVLGIAGLGRIGKAVAIRGAAFGMKLLAYEPYPDHAFAKQYNVTFVPFEKLLTESDYLSIHVPLTPESKHLICKKTLSMMKPGAFLINTARGGLVNEADLYEALKSGRIAGAGLDVFENEPPGKIPLLELDNVLATAHTAGVDVQSRDDMALSAAQSIIALSKGEWPTPQIVNPDAKGRFKWE